jgi:hypothetical protein
VRDAIDREKELKKWRPDCKIALIEAQNLEWNELFRSVGWNLRGRLAASITSSYPSANRNQLKLEPALRTRRNQLWGGKGLEKCFLIVSRT